MSEAQDFMNDRQTTRQGRIPQMVSTVITSYNKGPFLRETIESALGQDYSPQEVIVVDDGSTDDTRSIAAEFGDRIRYIYQQNQGQAGAKNRGIREARGEFIAFLDGDDLWREKKLSKQIPLFQGRSELGVVYSSVSGFSDRMNGVARTRPMRHARLRRGKVLKAILVRNFVPFSSAVVRYSALDRVGLFDERYRIAPDYDLFLRLAREYEFDYADEVLLDYWMGENRIGTQLGTKFQHVMRIQDEFLSRFYPDGFPKPAVVRAAKAQKYAEHGDWLLAVGKQRAAFRAHLSAVRWEPRRLQNWRSIIRDLIPNRLMGMLKRRFRTTLADSNETS